MPTWLGTPLQKYLQAAGVGTKAVVRAAIAAGDVTVDGETITRFAEPVTSEQDIVICGAPLVRMPTCVLLMNKPKKHVTAMEDEGEMQGLGRYIPNAAPPVFPVGRLDFNTQGALLFTNDGQLARRVLHPSHELPKTYRVKIRGHLAEDDPGFDRMRAGMTLDGVVYAPCEVEFELLRTRATWVRLVLREGKFREIRRMCAACGYQIVKLQRVAIGPLQLGDLNPRVVRALTSDEIAALYAATQLLPPTELWAPDKAN